MDTTEGTSRPNGTAYDGFISYSHAADDLLAPRLQSALQRFAKPWWKRRAVRIFRDESSLSANPHLWSSITEALDTSGWFVLLLSPDAAESEWVNQEIAYWVEHRDPKKILPVVTDGTFGWADGVITGSAVPAALEGVFTEEPRWVDVRWARGEEQLDLQDPRFADAVADVASTIRGMPKDELASEEVRQHRRTVRTAWAAGGLVTVLAVAAAGFGIQSGSNADEAERQARRAEENAAEAQQSATAEAAAREEAVRNAETARENEILAEENAKEAQASAQEAERQASLARARELAASAINAIDDDSQLSLRLALQAIDELPDGVNPGPDLLNALRESMYADRLTGSVPVPDGVGGLDVSPDGSSVAYSSLTGRYVELLDVETLEPIWRYEEETPDIFEMVSFSSEGTYVLVSVHDERTHYYDEFFSGEPQGEPNARLLILDTSDGSVSDTITIPGGCFITLGKEAYREDLSALGFGFVLCADEFDGLVRVVDPMNDQVLFEWGALDLPHIFLSGTGSKAVAFSGFNSEPKSAVVDMSNWRVQHEEFQSPFVSISEDGSLLAGLVYAEGRPRVHLVETATGRLLDRMVVEHFPWVPNFSPDGTRLVVGSYADVVTIFDPVSGEEELTVPVGFIRDLVITGDLVFHGSDEALNVWDVGPVGGDLDTVRLGLWVNGNSLFRGQNTVVAHVANINTGEWWFHGVDPTTGQLGPQLNGIANDFIPLNDGNALVFRPGENAAPFGPLQFPDEPPEVGPLQMLDLATGQVTDIAGCWMDDPAAYRHEPCPDGSPHPAGVLAQSIDGSEFMIIDSLLEEDAPGETFVSIWDAEDLVETERLNLGVLESWGSGLRRSVLTESFVIIHERFLNRVRVFDRSTLEEIPLGVSREDGFDPERLEIDQAGNQIWISTLSNEVWRLDLGDLELSRISEALPAIVRGLAPSPTGDRIAVMSPDNFLRVFSVGGDLLELVPLPNPSDAYWLDDEKMVVGTANGPWTVVTLNTGELIGIARARVRVGFSNQDCEFYNIDPCPTLEEIWNG